MAAVVVFIVAAVKGQVSAATVKRTTTITTTPISTASGTVLIPSLSFTPNMSSIIDKVTEDTLALYGHLAIFSDGIERLKYYQAFTVRCLVTPFARIVRTFTKWPCPRWIIR